MKKEMSREECVEFLKTHFRYHTGNSWNGESSYAARVKIHDGWIPRKLQDAAYALLEVEGAYDGINDLLEDWGQKHDQRWQAGFNGRSGGYLVLYQGGREPSGYKSYCTSCGQLNAKTVAEFDGPCGRCNENSRVDFSKPHMRTFSTIKGTDQGEDFLEDDGWDIDTLRACVALVKDFDSLVERCKKEWLYLAKNYKVVDEEYTVKKTRKVLAER